MDRTWRLSRHLTDAEMTQSAEQVATGYAGVTVEVEREDDDCFTIWFTAPQDDGEPAEFEVSIYDLGKDKVLSLEIDAGDNNAFWDDASQLAEDLADLWQATPLEL